MTDRELKNKLGEIYTKIKMGNSLEIAESEKENLVFETIKYISRLEGEIEGYKIVVDRLKAELDEAEDTIQFADKKLKEANAENENLKALNGRFVVLCDRFRAELKTANADIKKLTSGKCIYLSDDETTEYCVNGPCPKYKTEAQIKAEAYKELVEKLDTYIIWHFPIDNQFVADIRLKINDLLKELEGEDNV